MPKEEFRILSTTAILGYGFPEASFNEGMKRKPDLIAVDAGSSDPGPYYLGAGVSFTDRNAVKRDLEIMLKAGVPNKIPVVVGTAGGSGAEPHLDWCRKIIEEIAREQHLSFKMAIIHAELDKGFIKEEFRKGNVTPLAPAPALTEENIDASTHIVAQMGYAPFIKAFREGNPDVILAGRTYDPVNFAALPMMKGYDKGLCIHLGKILECGAICATPGSGSDCMFGYIGEDYFRVESLSPARKCTELSVAAHSLYEKTNPYELPGPGGYLDLHHTKFEQVSENAVKVSGTRFVPTVNTVKLEGSKQIGFRTVSIAGARDPVMIAKIDDIMQGVRARVADNFKGKLTAEGDNPDYRLNFTIYGRDGVMGQLEPHPTTEGCHELGIVIEAIARTQEEADTICSFTRSTMLHYGYEGRRATAGNLAFPFSPSDFHAGPVYVFSIYHLLKVDDPAKPFPVEYVEV
jgi:hypothetical protein